MLEKIVGFFGGDYLRIGIAIAGLVAIGLVIWRIAAWHSAYLEVDAAQAAQATAEAALKAETDCREGTACAQRIADARARGSQETGKAVTAALERARVAEEFRQAQAQAALDRAAAAARAARVKAAEWERRYQSAMSVDSICKAWSEQEVPCPTD